ncbi:hypothetical protein I4U23_011338 [Adineta vaga]|nr:hypothetical protein I4U23_011338 [Adineta vaga]
MSVSKIESLPNEILLHLFEKYINGVDIFVAFINKLNHRFDGLINQCQQIHFDFRSIRKNDFYSCLILLSNYIDKIKTINLSEKDTPGAIDAFLFKFPSLKIFNKIRQFNIDFDSRTVDKDRIHRFFCSLPNTNLSILSIKLQNASQFDISNFITGSILSLTTLKHLHLDIDSYSQLWNLQKLSKTNIEYLTIIGYGCTWNDFQYICLNSPGLKYVNVRIVDKLSNYSRSSIDKNIHIPPLLKLHTVIVHFIDRYTQVTWNMLVKYFEVMPNLMKLEMINSSDRFFNGNDWQILFETSLQKLIYFTLKILAVRLSQYSLDTILHTSKCFESQFWIEKKNFHILIIMCNSSEDAILNYQPIDYRKHKFDSGFEMNIETGTVQFWSVTNHSINNNQSITNLRISSKEPLSEDNFYFPNVTCLQLDLVNLSLIEWIQKYIDLSKVKELIISELEMNLNMINSLLLFTKNVSSLQIIFNQFINQQVISLQTNNNIKRLYISPRNFQNQNKFQDKYIRYVASLFPFVEHLKIDTIDFEIIPIIYISFPYLSSLALRFVNYYWPIDNVMNQQQWEKQLRYTTKLTFKCSGEWLTIWINETEFKESYK